MTRPAVLITGGEGVLASALRGEFGGAGWNVLAPGKSEMDVSARHSVDAWMASLNRLDLLINCAGITRDGLLLTQREEDRDAVLEVCLRGAFHCSREAARLMLPQGAGHIVNIASHSAFTGPAGQTAYAAAKAGLIALTKSLAAELGPAGIRVNAVLPGWFDSKLSGDAPPAARERALAANVLGRFGQPADAARFIRFLDGMPAVSGQVFCLDSRLSRAGV